MTLCESTLVNRESWLDKGYSLPQYDRAAMRERTTNEPVWLHFGAGNIFRAFPALLAQKLLNEGLTDKGIIAAEGYDFELIDKVYTPFDDLSISVTLIPDGSVRKTIVGSIAQSIKADNEGMARLREIFSEKSLQMVSFTITEKGYDIPQHKDSFLENLTMLCLHRYNNGAAPLALVSMDNCSQNGILLRTAVLHFANKFVDDGRADKGFLDYVSNPEMLSFPCTMIDKITPYPDESVVKMLSDDGFDNTDIIVTEKKSVTAPFVNAEEPEYLVVEDVFPNGRPSLEKAGVIFTNRETVDKVEKMKVCTCLNPLHTAISVFACMLGFTRISDAMKDTDLNALVKAVAAEGLPVVVDPGVISPQEFIDTVINVRLPNPYIPDTPQRIATDTSKKLAVRFGETIKAYMQSDSLDVGDLTAIPLVLAGWCRYLHGVDDNGTPFDLSPDPMLPELRSLLNDEKQLQPILSNRDIFGVDLFKAGIAGKVIDYYGKMKPMGGVREVLKKIYPDRKPGW